MDPPNGPQLIINEEAVSLTSSVSADGFLITALSLPLAPEYPLIKAAVTGSEKPNQLNHGSFENDRGV